MEPEVTLEPVAVKKTTAGRMLDCGATKIYELVRAGKLRTIRVGADERVLVSSIREYAQKGGDT